MRRAQVLRIRKRLGEPKTNLRRMAAVVPEVEKRYPGLYIDAHYEENISSRECRGEVEADEQR
jgi:hypothetical protein